MPMQMISLMSLKETGTGKQNLKIFISIHDYYSLLLIKQRSSSFLGYYTQSSSEKRNFFLTLFDLNYWFFFFNFRVYIPCIYILNKIDQISIEELDLIYRIPHAVPLSAHHKWNFDDLLEKTWEYLSLIRMWVALKLVFETMFQWMYFFIECWNSYLTELDVDFSNKSCKPPGSPNANINTESWQKSIYLYV